jgi:hypothetical protein
VNQGGVFVVGSGRCGSTLLSACIRMHAKLLSLSEWFAVLGGPKTLRDEPISGSEFWRLLSVPDSDTKDLVSGGNVPEILSGARAESPPILLTPLPHLSTGSQELFGRLESFVRGRGPASGPAHHAAVFEHLATLLGKELWIERSGGSLEYVRDILRCWPRARIVHLSRDGRDCALSMAKHPYFRVRVARVVSGRADLPVGECLDMPIPLSRYGAYWSAVVARGVEILSSLAPNRLLNVDFETLTRSPRSTLDGMRSFIGVDDPEEIWLDRVSALVREVKPRWSEVDPDDRESLERACRPGTRALERLHASRGFWRQCRGERVHDVRDNAERCVEGFR